VHTSTVTYLAQLFVSLFLAILFLQSGIDKIVDRPGNLSWLKGHFAKSPLGGFVPLLFGILTLVELMAGLLTGIGFVALMFTHDSAIAFYGAVVSAIAILCLFLGQRIAKEYAGAAVLVPYFLLVLVALYLLAG
jgi:hypothetical protein